MFNTYQGVLVSQSGDGTAVTGTTEGSVLLGDAKFTLPSKFLLYPGQALRLRAMGRISNIVTTPGTLTFRVKFNSTPIIVAASPAFQLNAVAKTNVTWVLDWDLTVRTTGSGTAATFMHSGQWQSESVVGSPVPASGGSGTLTIPSSAPAVGTGFDSTVANLIDLTAQFSLTGNSIQCHTYKLESLN
jgi:hypothetical protein